MVRDPYKDSSDIHHIWNYNLYAYKLKFYKSHIRYNDHNGGLLIKAITNALSKEEAEKQIKQAFSWIPIGIKTIKTYSIPYDIKDTMGTKVKLDVYKTIQTGQYYDNTKPLVYSHSITETLKFGETVELIQFKYDQLYAPNHLHKLTFDYENMKTEGLSIKMGYIKTLHHATKGKMMHCKEAIDTILANNKSALTEADIIEKAIVLMNEKNQIIAASKAGNKTNFFAIFFAESDVKESNIAILLKFGCESEQGVKTLKDTYKDVLQKITKIALNQQADSVMDVLGADWDELTTISMKIKEISGVLNEKVELNQVEFAESVPGTNNTIINHYIHKTNSGDKGAAILIYNFKKEHPEDSMRKILHQTVTTCPLHLKEKDLLDSILEEQTLDISNNITKNNSRFDEITARKTNLEKADKLGEALKQELKEIKEELASGKAKKIPEQILEKVAEGQLNKFKKEICLETQDYMFCTEEGIDKQTVKSRLETLGITIFDMVVI